MVQQQVKSVWQHMVGVICLNLTDRKHLGMVNKRYDRIQKMSIDILTWDYKDARDLHGIGKYGSDSYRIFYLNDIPKDVQDKELKKYVRKIRRRK